MRATFGEMLDTSPEGRASYYAMIARLTTEERVRKVAGLCRAAREFARAGIRRTRSEASEAEVELELVARLYGPDAARMLAGRLSSARG